MPQLCGHILAQQDMKKANMTGKLWEEAKEVLQPKFMLLWTHWAKVLNFHSPQGKDTILLRHLILLKDLKVVTLLPTRDTTQNSSLNRLINSNVRLLFLPDLTERIQDNMTNTFTKKDISLSVFSIISSTSEGCSRGLIKKLLRLWDSWLMLHSCSGLDN